MIRFRGPLEYLQSSLIRLSNMRLFLVAIFSVASLIPTGPAIGESAKSAAKGIVFVGMFRAPSDVKDTRTPCQHLRDFIDPTGKAHDVTGERPAVCDKVVDVIAGKADPSEQASEEPIRAAKIATDSHGRILITEPSTRAIHVFDFARRKYTRIDGTENERILRPYGVAVDGDNNVYVTDLELGVIAVFSAEGKFKNYIGQFKGERGFELPNSVAVDPATNHMYVADTARNFVLIFDADGRKLASIGKRGGGSGSAEFRRPTDLVLRGKELFVFDKQNRRIQVFDLAGRYRREIKMESLGTESPAGMAIDSRGLIYMLVDVGLIEVFNPQGQSLFQFGHYGTAAGEFMDPRGMYIDSADRLYVSDTGNQRIEVFQITGTKK
jgi:DNA-binding beta-propeller fold protein YncE